MGEVPKPSDYAAGAAMYRELGYDIPAKVAAQHAARRSRVAGMYSRMSAAIRLLHCMALVAALLEGPTLLCIICFVIAVAALDPEMMLNNWQLLAQMLSVQGIVFTVLTLGTFAAGKRTVGLLHNLQVSVLDL